MLECIPLCVIVPILGAGGEGAMREEGRQPSWLGRHGPVVGRARAGANWTQREGNHQRLWCGLNEVREGGKEGKGGREGVGEE